MPEVQMATLWQPLERVSSPEDRPRSRVSTQTPPSALMTNLLVQIALSSQDITCASEGGAVDLPEVQMATLWRILYVQYAGVVCGKSRAEIELEVVVAVRDY